MRLITEMKEIHWFSLDSICLVLILDSGGLSYTPNPKASRLVFVWNALIFAITVQSLSAHQIHPEEEDFKNVLCPLPADAPHIPAPLYDLKYNTSKTLFVKKQLLQ